MAVDVLGDLGDQHHEADGAGAFGDERAEVDWLRADGAERVIDRGEQGAAAGAVGGRVGHAEAEPGGVVELGGVEADVGVAEGEPVRDRAGTGDAERAPGRRGRAGDGGGEEREERLGREEGAVAAVDQRAGEGFDLGRVGAARGQGELGVDRLQRVGHPGLERAGAGDLLPEAVQAEAFHAQAVAERVPPADVGPAVRVQSDPGGEDDRRRVEVEPAVGPALAGGVEQGAGERVERVAAVRDRGSGGVELLVQGRFGRAVREQAERRDSAARGLGDSGICGGRGREGGVGGEDAGVARAFEPGSRVLQAGAGVFDQLGGETAQGGLGRGGVGAADIGCQARGAVGGGGVPETGDRFEQVGLGEGGFVEAAADGEGRGEHRVAERVGGGAGAGGPDQVDQVGCGRLGGGCRGVHDVLRCEDRAARGQAEMR